MIQNPLPPGPVAQGLASQLLAALTMLEDHHYHHREMINALALREGGAPS